MFEADPMHPSISMSTSGPFGQPNTSNVQSRNVSQNPHYSAQRDHLNPSLGILFAFWPNKDCGDSHGVILCSTPMVPHEDHTRYCRWHCFDLAECCWFCPECNYKGRFDGMYSGLGKVGYA